MATTENVKTVLAFAINFGMKIEDALLDDGKITTRELLGLVPVLIKIPGLIKAIPQLKVEFLDLDEAEKAELIVWLATTLDLDNDTVENYIETAFSFLIALSELIQVKPVPVE